LVIGGEGRSRHSPEKARQHLICTGKPGQTGPVVSLMSQPAPLIVIALVLESTPE
jgi:hypothetical protein